LPIRKDHEDFSGDFYWREIEGIMAMIRTKMFVSGLLAAHASAASKNCGAGWGTSFSSIAGLHV
jgi:hypothetical protein